MEKQVLRLHLYAIQALYGRGTEIYGVQFERLLFTKTRSANSDKTSSIISSIFKELVLMSLVYSRVDIVLRVTLSSMAAAEMKISGSDQSEQPSRYFD